MTQFLHHFADPEVFWLLPLLAAAGLAALWGRRQKRRAVRLLGQVGAVRKLLRTEPRVRRLRGAFLWLGLLLLLVGSAGPRWGWDFPQDTLTGQDVVIVLDVSRSMLAEQPTRLERALRALNDLADQLQKRGGQRLALIVFAARPHLVFPLTRDYDHFRTALDEIKAGDLPRDIRPDGDVPEHSGMRIGAGLMLAVNAFDKDTRGPRAILLLSDGDDPAWEEEEWRHGINAARAARIPILTVGIGDPAQESVIIIKEVKNPGAGKTQARVEEGPLQFEGKDVKTRLEEQVLKDIAEGTGGRYVPARTDVLPLGSLLPDILAHQAATGADGTPSSVPVLQQRRAWVHWPALLLLAATLLFREKRGRVGKQKFDREARRSADAEIGRIGARVLARCVLLIFVPLALLQLAAFGPDDDDWVRQGNEAFARGEWRKALSLYEKAETGTTDPGLVAFNKAAAHYLLKEYREAELHYLRCLDDRQAPTARQTQALFSLGTALLRQADEKSIDTLDRAVEAFKACLAQPELPAQLASDARYNLELARQLRAQAVPPPPSPPDDGNVHDPNPPKDPPMRKKTKEKNGKQGNGKPGQNNDPGSGTTEDPHAKPTFGDKLAGGSLQSLPDASTLVKRTPQETAAFLEDVVSKIREQRRGEGQRRPNTAIIKDW